MNNEKINDLFNFVKNTSFNADDKFDIMIELIKAKTTYDKVIRFWKLLDLYIKIEKIYNSTMNDDIDIISSKLAKIITDFID